MPVTLHCVQRMGMPAGWLDAAMDPMQHLHDVTVPARLEQHHFPLELRVLLRVGCEREHLHGDRLHSMTERLIHLRESVPGVFSCKHQLRRDEHTTARFVCWNMFMAAQ